jgi:hypothetical protein
MSVIVPKGEYLLSERCAALHLPRGSATVERVEVDVTACDQVRSTNLMSVAAAAAAAAAAAQPRTLFAYTVKISDHHLNCLTDMNRASSRR